MNQETSQPRLDAIVLLLRDMSPTSSFVFCDECLRLVEAGRHGRVLLGGNKERCRGSMIEHSRDDLIQLLDGQ